MEIIGLHWHWSRVSEIPAEAAGSRIDFRLKLLRNSSKEEVFWVEMVGVHNDKLLALRVHLNGQLAVCPVDVQEVLIPVRKVAWQGETLFAVAEFDIRQEFGIAHVSRDVGLVFWRALVRTSQVEEETSRLTGAEEQGDVVLGSQKSLFFLWDGEFGIAGAELQAKRDRDETCNRTGQSEDMKVNISQILSQRYQQ